MSDQIAITALPEENVSPSLAVVTTVADKESIDPLACPPIYNAIDPEALDHLFANRRGGTVEFEYAGYAVTVENTHITVAKSTPGE